MDQKNLEQVKTFFKHIFLKDGSKKLIAFVSAIILWFVINHTITTTKTLTNVPIRIVNLAQHKTIEGIQEDGTLEKQVTLTLSGRKSTISRLEASDLEVVIDATGKEKSWIPEISKRNLVNLHLDIDLSTAIQSMVHSTFLLEMLPLITLKVPVKINYPLGEPPSGYQFLDIWPQLLEHTVSGPKFEVEELQKKGLDVLLNLSNISENQLSTLSPSTFSLHQDEVSFPVPLEWLTVQLPFLKGKTEIVNDPAARTLHIDFLKKEQLSIEILPIRVSFSPKSHQTINPETYTLNQTDWIKTEHTLHYLNLPLYARNVSRLFLDIVKNNLELTIIAVPKSEQLYLDWSVEFINPLKLEDLYIQKSTSSDNIGNDAQERVARNRFREYMRQFKLYSEDEKPIDFKIELRASRIYMELVK